MEIIGVCIPLLKPFILGFIPPKDLLPFQKFIEITLEGFYFLQIRRGRKKRLSKFNLLF